MTGAGNPVLYAVQPSAAGAQAPSLTSRLQFPDPSPSIIPPPISLGGGQPVIAAHSMLPSTTLPQLTATTEDSPHAPVALKAPLGLRPWRRKHPNPFLPTNCQIPWRSDAGHRRPFRVFTYNTARSLRPPLMANPSRS